MPLAQQHIRCPNKNCSCGRKHHRLGLPNCRTTKDVAGQNHLTHHNHGKNQTCHGDRPTPTGQALDECNISIDHCACILRGTEKEHPLGLHMHPVGGSLHYSTARALSKSSLPPLTFSAKFLYEDFWATSIQAS